MERKLKWLTAGCVSAVAVATALFARWQLLEAAAEFAAAAPYGVPGPVLAQKQSVGEPPAPFDFAAVKWIRRPLDGDDPTDEEEGPPQLFEINPKEFIRPFDKPFFTPEERKKLMEEPGVKFVRRGPKGSPFYEMGDYVWPWDDDQFRVEVQLEANAAPEAKELAEEVRRRLKFARPQNPGRRGSFPLWSSTSTPLPGPAPPRTSSASGPFRGPTPLVHSGWRLKIRHVEPRADGWQALVHVFPVLRTEDYGQVARIRDFHAEVYSWKDGELRLDRDSLDPNRTSDPEAGIECVILD